MLTARDTARGAAAPSVLPDRLRLPLAFEPERLAGDLARVKRQAWIAHFVPQHYEGDWSVIPLRGPAGVTHPILQIAPNPGVTAFADMPLLGETPYFREALAAFACPLQCVRLMRLTPGSVIKTHSDPDLDAAEGVARIHVPITTNPGVDFRLNGAPVAMAPGEAWYLRLADPHSVANQGDSDRVHLVIDAEVNAWLAGVLAAAAV